MELNGGYVLLPQRIEVEAPKLLKNKDIKVIQAGDPKPEVLSIGKWKHLKEKIEEN